MWEEGSRHIWQFRELQSSEIKGRKRILADHFGAHMELKKALKVETQKLLELHASALARAAKMVADSKDSASSKMMKRRKTLMPT